MRIITGSARGLKLFTLEGDTTRPTAERTKEAIFSVIQFDIEGRTVLDLYAGSGQMALEALSRGASQAVLCDRSKEAVGIIKKNAQRARLADKCTIHTCDAQKLLKGLGDAKFDLIFLDPPYALKLLPDTLKCLLTCDRVKPASLIICESAAEADVFCGDTELSSHFIIKRASKYGAAFVTILQPKEI